MAEAERGSGDEIARALVSGLESADRELLADFRHDASSAEIASVRTAAPRRRRANGDRDSLDEVSEARDALA